MSVEVTPGCILTDASATGAVVLSCALAMTPSSSERSAKPFAY